MNRTARSVEELFPIVAFARAGDLKSVKAWIDAGSPLNLPAGKKTRRQSPLQIAIQSGFLTLTEMLLEGGADATADQALYLAVNSGRTDIARLLLDRGVPVTEVHFSNVCESGQADLISLFLERGASPVEDAPFYGPLTYQLKPLLGIFKGLLEKDPRLQPQADAVLGYYANKMSPRGVALMIWAGARPDAEITIGCEHQSETPLEIAASTGDVATLKTMKPEKYPASIGKLTSASNSGRSNEMLNYLLSMGAPLNDSEDGSSSLLQSALWRLEWYSGRGFGYSAGGDSTKVSQHITAIEQLLGQGAKFPKIEPRSMRRTFVSIGSERIIELLEIFRKTGAFTPEFLIGVISTPKLKEVLGSRWANASKIALGEVDKVSAGTSTPEAVKAPKPLASIEELRERAEYALLYFVRHSSPDFMERSITKHWSEGEFRRRLKMPPEDKRDAAVILKEVCKAINQRIKSGKFVLEPQGSSFCPKLTILPDANWRELKGEVCGADEGEHIPLSKVAKQLLARLETTGPEWETRRIIAKQIGSHGAEFEKQLCAEIEAKRGIEISVERRNVEGDPSEEQLRFEIKARHPVPAFTTVINLRWDQPMEHFKKADFDKFREVLFDLVLKADPESKTPIDLFKVHTPVGLAKVFPKLVLDRFFTAEKIAKLLRGTRLPEEIGVAYDFQSFVPQWWLALYPKSNWRVAQARIIEERNRPSLAKQFGLSGDAALLLTWIVAQPAEKMLGSWTPVVEPNMDSEIGFQAEWPKENLPAFFQMLCDEINDKTAYNLSLIPWKESGQLYTRIKVIKRQSNGSSLINDLLRLAGNHGTAVTKEQIEQIAEILSEKKS
jgi:ankyrin repeat protein